MSQIQTKPDWVQLKTAESFGSTLIENTINSINDEKNPDACELFVFQKTRTMINMSFLPFGDLFITNWEWFKNPPKAVSRHHCGT